MRARGVKDTDAQIVCWEVMSEPEDLLQFCARQGFWDLEVGYLRDLASFVKLELRPDASAVECVEALAMHAIDGATEKEVQDAMMARAKHGGGSGFGDAAKLGKDNELILALDKREIDEIHKMIDKDKSAAESKLLFKERANEIGAKLLGHGDIDAALSERGAKQKSLMKAAAEKRFPASVGKSFKMEKLPSQFDGQMCAPDGVHVYRDDVLQRWLCCSKWGNRSRAFALWGFRTALLMLLRWSWLQALQEKKLSPLDCPVAGIWEHSRTGNVKNDEKNEKACIDATIR